MQSSPIQSNGMEECTPPSPCPQLRGRSVFCNPIRVHSTLRSDQSRARQVRTGQDKSGQERQPMQCTLFVLVRSLDPTLRTAAPAPPGYPQSGQIRSDRIGSDRSTTGEEQPMQCNASHACSVDLSLARQDSYPHFRSDQINQIRSDRGTTGQEHLTQRNATQRNVMQCNAMQCKSRALCRSVARSLAKPYNRIGSRHDR